MHAAVLQTHMRQFANLLGVIEVCENCGLTAPPLKIPKRIPGGRGGEGGQWLLAPPHFATPPHSHL
jgi:hypothetical protein